MNTIVIKRNKKEEPFDITRIENALSKAFSSCHIDISAQEISELAQEIQLKDKITVEEISDQVEETLVKHNYYKVAKAYILYRYQHQQSRFIKERIDYMNKYSHSSSNAATASETDSNANITIKNVANLEGEVYKTTNRIILRLMMKDKLKELYPEVAELYTLDLNHHIIYSHDESVSPILKHYCNAVTLYPLMINGIGDLDGITPTPPNDLQSFSGLITNLIFLLSSLCKGAVGVAGYFIALNYYIIQEFGEDWYNKLDEIITTSINKKQRTIRDAIYKAFKLFLYGINQVAGNRSYLSPFVNISYFDHTYFTGLFEQFYYPDSTVPQWEAIDCLLKLFMKFFNNIRLTLVLTFPVETMCMVYDPNTNDIIDLDYKNFTAEMYSEGHSFFTYISDSVDSVSNCCRLLSKLQKNTFSPTSGLTGIMTGSCNVITLNINRIIQDWFRTLKITEDINSKLDILVYDTYKESFTQYLTAILDRVYKYHIAYKTMLYELEELNMITSSSAGYIFMKKLYCTVGLNGLNEAAMFMGYEVSNNTSYILFLQLILNIVKEENTKHSITGKKPFIFNSEIVPAESLGGKNYRWDKEEGYWVPDDRNLYNSYFYDAHDNTSILDKFILHGKLTCQYTDGGSALHCNLSDHLSKEQYLHLINFAIKQGTNYFTFNIPNSKCEDCKYITKHPITLCPKCGSTHITQYSRIIGYLRPITSFGIDRQQEAQRRVYHKVL